MKDFFNQEVHIGDLVAFNEPYYKRIVSGKIIKFTPKGVKIVYTQSCLSRSEKDTFVSEGQFVKAPKQYEINRSDNNG